MMKGSSLLFPILLWTGVVVQATDLELSRRAEVELNQNPDNQEQCSGMYSRKAWGGPSEPFILTKFLRYIADSDNDQHDDPLVAFIIFEWKDEGLIGVPLSDNSTEKQYVCGQDAIDQGYCTNEEFGQFILAANASELSINPIDTRAIHLKDENRPAVNYPISKTGYYCVLTAGFDDIEYTAITEFRNAYGELPGAQIAKLPFYGGLAIVYAVVGIFWAFLYVQHRHDILPVQNYITATIVFLVVEMLSTWGYYDHMNRKGSDIGSKILMILVSILNAARNSFSFFLLLIVCMGYGVVKSSLGRKMLFARILAITHFVFGVIYAITSLTLAPEDAGPLVLFVVLPLAATLTGFYVWTLNSLAFTLKDLNERKQTVKAQMYRNLWWCILGSVLVIFGFFFLNSFTIAEQGDPNFTPDHWQTRWFVLDGWLNLVYLGDVCYIAYLWRPTAENRRFAMSDEISQDDEGFEIASVRNSLDEGDEDSSAPHLPPYDRHQSSTSDTGAYTKDAKHDSDKSGGDDDDFGGYSGGGGGGMDYRGASPLPAPTPQRPGARPRESLDGETMFAVGEDGEAEGFSDSDDEGAGLHKHG